MASVFPGVKELTSPSSKGLQNQWHLMHISGGLCQPHNGLWLSCYLLISIYKTGFNSLLTGNNHTYFRHNFSGTYHNFHDWYQECFHRNVWRCDSWLDLYGCVKSLWPRDAIGSHRSGSTLVQVMAWCLTAPSHYLVQCWFLLSEVLWHSPEINFLVSTQATILHNEFENLTFEVSATSLMGQWVNVQVVFSPVAPLRGSLTGSYRRKCQ